MIILNTIISNGNDKNCIEMASKVLNKDGLVAFPTETVYGLGANALNAEAAAKIYAAKGRPSDNPLIVHIASIQDVYKIASDVPENATALMEAFWPGPLTIILPKKDIVPDGTTGGLNTVAIRMPSHPVALSLIKESGVLIAAPSANTSGRPSPTNASHVIEDMDGKIDMIIDGGDVGIGIESTIIDLTGDIPTILRPGFITKAMLENIIGPVQIDKALIEPDPNLRPKAPGMKYTHYAPKGELTIIESLSYDNQAIISKINELVNTKKLAGFKTAVIATEENATKYQCDTILIIGKANGDSTIAARLYALLRECDKLDIDYIYSEAYSAGELGGAIMNRLLKAAGHRVINV